MAYLVTGSHDPIIEKTFQDIRSKMSEMQRVIRETEEKAKELKMAAREKIAQERLAVDKQHTIRNKMQEIDVRINKIETQTEFVKEKLFTAKKRDEENIKSCHSLELNRLHVPSFDEKITEKRNRFSAFVEGMTKKNKKMDILKTKILEAEKRERKARKRLSNVEEVLRLNEQSKRMISRNYRPKTDEEYEYEIKDLKHYLSKAVKKYKAKEAELATLEKEERQIDYEIAQTKKKILNTKQAQNEARGSRK